MPLCSFSINATTKELKGFLMRKTQKFCENNWCSLMEVSVYTKSLHRMYVKTIVQKRPSLMLFITILSQQADSKTAQIFCPGIQVNLYNAQSYFSFWFLICSWILGNPIVDNLLSAKLTRACKYWFWQSKLIVLTESRDLCWTQQLQTTGLVYYT